MEEISLKTAEKGRLEYISSVSHELKTPIALILGYAEGLKNHTYDDAEAMDYYCDVIIDEVKKMDNIIKRLISLSALEYEPYDVVSERIDMSRFVEECCTQGNVLAHKFGGTISYSCEPECIVNSDVSLVEDVLRNYLSNAINYMSGDKKIEITVSRVCDNVRVSVYNTGDQIQEEYMPYIWEKLYKIDESRNKVSTGQGIGLSVVKDIMKKLGGSCGVDNRTGGVEFWFELAAV